MQAHTGQFWTYIRGEIAKNRDVTDLKDLAAKCNALKICSTYLESSRQHRVRSLDVCTYAMKVIIIDVTLVLLGTL